jgi:CRISPR-associated endonuclease/helicase Cas3
MVLARHVQGDGKGRDMNRNQASDEAIAHVRQGADGQWRVHPLRQHLECTAELASGFARRFGNEDWARVAGLWHDLGKYKPAFQGYLRADSGYDPSPENQSLASHDHAHATAGAVHASVQGPLGQAIAYVIAGHHGGLPDWNTETHKGLEQRLTEKEQLQDALAGDPPEDVRAVTMPSSLPTGRPAASADVPHLWLRMLFSSLVDADFLDTEAFMAPDRAVLRSVGEPPLEELLERLDRHMGVLQSGAPDTPVNRLRRAVLEDCRSAADQAPGLFSLTVPTGGGKTLSSMAFALSHAVRHGKRRVIVAIPYTSIIEQTAETLREVFGSDAVLEHHSNFDPANEKGDRRPALDLAAENWDAPIVVTTNVQLFESLYAARTSTCRKLHNIVDSVVILDEAQMLPPDYLKPILSVLRGLAGGFGVSVVLCTATQPALVGDIGTGEARMKGLEHVRELMLSPRELGEALQRVRVRVRGSADETTTFETLAQELAQHERVLCVVNTRRDCRELHSLMPEGTTHLSALMCAEHRSATIRGIKRRLLDGDVVRVISTQLVEAGVDLDFPVVYRALAGLDSIAQAAGRCNREGRLNEKGELGEVVVFTPPKPAPPGLLRKGQDAGAEMLRCFPSLLEALGPDAFERYFTLFYGRVNTFDRKGIQELVAGSDACRGHFQFRTAADRFKLIDDGGQTSVVVWYVSGEKDSTKLIESLRWAGPSRKLMRKLQRFTVNVRDREANALREQGAIEEVKGVWVQALPGLYDPVLGLRADGPVWTGEELVI